MTRTGRTPVPWRVLTLVVALTVVPLAVFLALGTRLLDQDRRLEEQRARDRLQTAAELVAATLHRAISSSEQRLISAAADWPDGAIAVTMTSNAVDVRPPGRVAYLPVVPALQPVPLEPFRDAEVLEFQKRDRIAAIAAYRAMAFSADRAVRAGALLRLARNLDEVGRHDQALDAYAALAGTDDIAEAGVVLGLSAAWARCVVLERLARGTELKAEAERLRQDLAIGRWPVVESVYLAYAADADRWIGRPVAATRSELFSTALSTVWRDRERRSFDESRSSRRSIAVGGEQFAVVSQPAGTTLRVLIASGPFVRSEWLSGVEAVAAAQSVAVEVREIRAGTPLFDTARATVTGSASSSTTVSGALTGLPWNLVIGDPSAGATAGFVDRRRLFLGGFALLAVLAGTASWLIVRAVAREVAVARLQSDFVAAVSHEFRTPLTTLRQFTDRLRDQGGLNDDDRRICYEVQARATDRLTRLVESVLDLGRMEAGARAYRFEPHDCAEIVQRVVADFGAQPQAAGRRIDLHRNGPMPIEADEEALSRAVWNLLDNAVKYSPDGGPIDVGLDSRDGSSSIAVRDRGLGIPAHEQEAIFGRFQRGDSAKLRGIKGTGIGLAMVTHIVRAHRGRIEVESRPGGGSTFTIVLPQKG